MDFKQAVIRCVRDNYANFNGRAARPEFWYFMLACVIGGFVLGMFSNMLSLLFNLGVLLPTLAVGARRLHDIGKSGWLQLVLLVPLLGLILLIYWFVQPSGGPNQYGEGPALADEPAAVPPGAA